MDSPDIVNLPVPLFLEVAAVLMSCACTGLYADDLRVQTGSDANLFRRLNLLNIRT